MAMARVRDYLAWEIVRDDIKKQQKDGNIDPARAQTLQIYIDKAKGKIPEAIRQAYCIVVTVSEKDEVQAFKITVNDEPHFNAIKGDKRSRVKDTAVEAAALLPDGPYNLWRAGEMSRRVKDLGRSPSFPICRRCSRPAPFWIRWRVVASRAPLSCGWFGRMGHSGPGGYPGRMRTP